MPLSSPEYQILETVHESSISQVFRAQRRSDQLTVILKSPRTPYPSTEELNHYRREYELTKSLQVPGVIEVLGFETFDRSVAIVLEDFDAIPLNAWHPRRRIEEFLGVAIDIATALGTVHDQNIIHKDINSSNIVINPRSREVKLIDFGIATKLSRENPTLENPNVLEGTLPYISPEQTGRMNRYLDYRTDFYSLGVTFYELLSGTLPFISDDPLEIIYCHLARTPPHLPPTIPPMVSQIVMKLMAKNAEDRYQSAWGLRADLEECYRQWQRSGEIIPFEPGQSDLRNRLEIPQKLYGREGELETLLSTAHRVHQTGRSELLLVKGGAGLGKTRLIQEIYKPITGNRGYFLAGKCDQMERSVPYGVLISALEGLVRQILAEKETTLNQWRDSLLRAVGNNGRIIQELLPSLANLWGDPPPLVPLGAEEQQNRFHSVVQNFMAVLGQNDRPVVIFLDDLQWADQATLELLGRILTDDRDSSLLIIGAYRDNEVDMTHPLPFALEKWQINPTYIELYPFTEPTIIEFLADTLHTDLGRVAPLAQLIHRQTAGNPFFMVELCKQFHREGLLQYDGINRRWLWDMAAIEAMGVTDNVVELLLRKLRELPQYTQNLLGQAACVGATFPLAVLVSLTNHPPDRVFDALLPALNMGLIGAVGTLNQELRAEVLTFSHDRIQQASRELITLGELPQIHYQLAQFYREKANIFTIVDHYNQALSLITDTGEQEQIAELNYQALLKAKASVAYRAAIEYGETALQLIPASSPLTFKVYLELGSLYFLEGRFTQSEALLPELFDRAQSITDRAGIWILQIQIYRATNRLETVIDVGIKALAHLGVKLPRHPRLNHIIVAILWFQWITWAQKVESWLELPPLNNPHKRLALEIINLISSSAFEKEPKLIPIMPTEVIGITLRYGATIGSDTGIASLGLICCGVLQRMELGDRLARVGLEIAYRYPSANLPRVIFIVNAFTHHWRHPLQATLPQLLQCVSKGQELGNLEMVSAGASFYCNHLFFSGENLDRVYGECGLYDRLILRFTPDRGTVAIDIIRATIDFLQGKENSSFEQIPSTSTPFEQYQKDLSRLMISYLFNDLPLAVQIAQDLEPRESAVFSMFSLVVANFYGALTYLAQMGKMPKSKRQTWQKKTNKIAAKLKKWADFCPANHRHRYELLQGEQARLQNQTQLAIESYDRAISYAKAGGFLQDEALCNELAGKFHLQGGRIRLARAYLEEACYCYSRWGASQKVAHLEQQYAELQLNPTQNSNSISTITTASTTSQNLDISSLMRASQAIASEMILDRLLSNLMDILVKNAGAERGFLLLPPLHRSRQTNELEILATFNNGAIQIHPNLVLTEWIPPSVLAFTMRTQQPIVLDDSKNEGDFTQDPLVQTRNLRSILCAPLLDQGKLVGIIYLENNLATAAFTPDRVQLLQLLSGQAAIAIENSFLYTNLEKTIEENLRMRSELDVAQRIQQMFLPKESELLQIKDLDIAGIMIPAAEVGGDYYDVLQIEDKIIFAIGDVTGHGLTSGIIAIVAQASLRTLTDPTDLNRINHVLYESSKRLQNDLNMTLLVMTYCQGKMTITGQHEEILVLRHNGTIEQIDTGALGFPLGLEPDITPFIHTKTIELLPQETIVLYTDGIPEAENHKREFYGTARLMDVLYHQRDKPAQEIREAILTDLKQFIGQSPILDDITLLVIKRSFHESFTKFDPSSFIQVLD